MTDDPFREIRNKREEREAQLSADVERERLKFERHAQKIKHLLVTYNKVVIEVMEQLRLAAYPQEHLYSPQEKDFSSYYPTSYPTSLHWQLAHREGDRDNTWRPKISVSLILNSNDDPVRFECTGDCEGGIIMKSTTDLSREGLIVVLSQLVSDLEEK
jgi:hypothetical protein